MVNFAILAPVPAQHLESGLEVTLTHDYVSYGSQKWELFREIDELRGDERVPMLIYPSHEADKAQLTYEICWVGWYIGHVDDTAQKLKDQNNGHRPSSTVVYSEDNAYGWAVFWRIEELQKLPASKQFPIGKLESYKSRYWRKNRAPFGPEVVAYSDWMEELFQSEEEKPAYDIVEPLDRLPTIVNRIIRDTVAAKQLKYRYGFRCQVCGLQLALAPGRYYAEVHHVRPLGGDHGGTDTNDNMLVLCPNHHALFDYGVPKFLSERNVEIHGQQHKLTSLHILHRDNIKYHNELNSSRL